MTKTTQRARNRRSSQAVTMKDVAELAGVSSMTVSFVINGKKVTDKSRQAVLAAIDKLGYTPNSVARALASANTARIGLLYQEYEGRTHGFITDLLVGAVRQTTRLGLQLVIQKAGLSPSEVSSAITALVDRGVAGVLLPGQFAYALMQLPEPFCSAVPMIALAPGADAPSMGSVGIDDFKAATEITRLLTKLGHRRIGFIHGIESHPASMSRYDGYVAALREAGLEPDLTLIGRGYFGYKDALPAAAALLGMKEPPTAVFAANDEMAAAVISVAHRRNIRIPEDLAIVGFDDAPIATQLWPTLSTVRQPLVEIAETAVNLLGEAITAGKREVEPRTTILPFAIIQRETTGSELTL